MSRPVYLGTSEFAATILRRLAESGRAPVLVVTPPDRPRGRGRHTVPCPVAAMAQELDLALLQTADVNQPEPVAKIRETGAQPLAVCAFGQIIREPLLSDRLILNVHPSLLPRWRGAAPVERAIIEGDAATGVCIIRLTEGLDSGPVAMREEIVIGADENYGSLSRRLAETGGELLVESLGKSERGELDFTEQAEAGATYAEKIEPAERRIDPSMPADRLSRLVRGLTPHIGAYLQLTEDERLGVRGCTAVDLDLAAGELAAIEGELFLGCGAGAIRDALRLDLVQPPGRRPMPAADYLRGNAPPSRVLSL